MLTADKSNHSVMGMTHPQRSASVSAT